MKKILYTTFFLLSLILTSSCDKDNAPAGERWGHTEYYEGSFLKEYEPVRMTRTLRFELNPDADAMLNNGGEVRFQVSSDKDRFVAPNNVRVYFDDELCEDYSFTIHPKSDNRCYTGRLGFEFDDAAAEGVHTLYLVYKVGDCKFTGDRFDGEEVQNSDLKADINALSEGMIIEKENVSNPAHVILGWVLAILIGSLLVWLLILKNIFFESIKFGIMITGDYYAPIASNGCYKVILTRNYKKQNIFQRIFIGKVLYVQNPQWISDIEFSAFGKKGVRMRIANYNDFSCDNSILKPNNEYTLKSLSDNAKMTITMQ